MADIIHLLPDSVANQIAAGEVIQRPSSVIKELMENAVDAGATSIDVWVIDAGKTCIQVMDNGKGMSETDARLSFERHATSKITKASDLFDLHTMGFRGEALPSIAAVSQVDLKTKTKEAELGTWLSLNGSKIIEQKPVACQTGTTFTISNLFYNVPARRRFLRSNQTELSNIMTEFERVVLVHPDISFTFHRDNTLILDLRTSSFRKRITSLFGSNLDKQLLPVHVETALVKIDGFVGTPQSSRAKGAKQFFFINQRYMRHPYFNRAIMTAFERLIPADKQVPYFYCLDVDPSKIDVNIHPTKTEIKFEDDQSIWQIILSVTKEALGRFNAVPTIDFSESMTPEIPTFSLERKVDTPKIQVDQHYNPFKQSGASENKRSYSSDSWEELYATLKKTATTAIPSDSLQNNTLEQVISSSEEDKVSSDKELKEFIQYKGRYILTSVKSGLMIIDQNRAHMRILYDKYMSEIENGHVVSQELLFPELMQLPITKVSIFNDQLKMLESVGFDISDLGSGSYAIHGVPAGAEKLKPVEMVLELFEVLLNKETLSKEKLFYHVALTLAKKNAIEQGQILYQEGIKQLIDELFSCKIPNYTPDGKLVLTILPDDKMEGFFR